MYTSSLPLFPTNERIQSYAEEIAVEILLIASSAERRPIEVYGRCLLDKATPSNGQTCRFWQHLHLLAYRLPTYLTLVAHLSTDTPTLRTLQDEIARQVAKGVGS